MGDSQQEIEAIKKSWFFIILRAIQKVLGWYLLALFLVMFGKIWVR